MKSRPPPARGSSDGRPCERTLAEKRTASDAARRTDRAESRKEREARRAVHDRTRHHGRGGRQEHESLERERRRDDEDLDRERALSDELASEERRMTDDIMSHKAQALAGRGERTFAPLDEHLAPDRALDVALQLALDEVARIETSAAALLEEESSGPGGVITEHVHAVLRSAKRIDEALRPLRA